MMKLKVLCDVMDVLEVIGSTDDSISALHCDSRRVEEGTLFFALSGAVVDGSRFIPQAIVAGAIAVVTEQLLDQVPSGVTVIRVGNVRRSMAFCAALFYGNPSHAIPVVGVTGTNGKTTTSYLLESIFKQAGYRPAVFGTVDYRFESARVPAANTTPESLDLQQLMARFRADGADAMILEVSSHALKQHRADGVAFDAVVFTNLTPEHLDYHPDMADYYQSKSRLFTALRGTARAIVNGDDAYGAQLAGELPDCTVFGAERGDVFARRVKMSRTGTSAVFATPAGDLAIDSRLIGGFNLSNLLAAVATTASLDIPLAKIAAGIKGAPQVPGRVESVDNDRGILALVDYAHTGDALRQVLKTLSGIEAGRRITVVGCGGDRDRSKRPVMAAAAVELSDIVLLTSDNPRTEDPLQILQQMRAGAISRGIAECSPDQLDRWGEKVFCVVPDRRLAIETAVRVAKSGDIILVAGKGHEDYQILGVQKVHFDDREELFAALTDGGGQR